MDIKNVLLTGHRGFIGKNLYKELKSLGLNVYTVEKDFLDDPYWKEVLYNKVKSSDMIFHVGAISDTTLKDSQKMLLYNYEFSKVLIDHAYDLHTKVIYSSSAANEASGNGIPNNIYGRSKLLVANYGIAKGGNLDNAIVVKGNKVLNSNGLRNNKEFVNHKILDCMGDLYLSGYRIIGSIKCSQGGHSLTNKLLNKLFENNILA